MSEEVNTKPQASVLLIGAISSQTIGLFEDRPFDILVSPTEENAWQNLAEHASISVVISMLESADVFLEQLRIQFPICGRVLCVADRKPADIVSVMKQARPHYVLSDTSDIESSLDQISHLVTEIQDEKKRKSSSIPTFRDGLATTIPTLHSELSQLVKTLEADQHLACFYIDLSRLRPVERKLGIALHSELFSRAGAALQNLRGDKLRKDDLICRTGDSDGYICFTGPSRYGENATANYEMLAARINSHLNEELANAMRGLTRMLPHVTIGAARILENPMIRGERLIMRLVSEAKQAAELSSKEKLRVRKSELQDLIIQKQLRPVFQPIVDMGSAEIFAFEALTRGPKNSLLESPDALFGVADEVDLTLELDRACFRTALRAAKGCEPIHRLFLNLLPQSFHDERFIAEEVYALLDAASLTPANLVFEITEKLAIENFSAFKQALGRYTDMGFGVAVDDVGTQHSNLESIMALQPHFIKLSDILCHGVAHSPVKREMVGSLQRIAETIDAVIVAEGIEDVDDFRVLRDLGIRFGQGYYFCRPQPGFQKVDPQAIQDVQVMDSDLFALPLGTPGPTGDFEEPTRTHFSLKHGQPAKGKETAPTSKRNDATEPFILKDVASSDPKESAKDK